MNPLLNTDAYKLFHRQMYPDNTSLVFSNGTMRSMAHYPGNNKDGGIVAGIQMFLMNMVNDFNKNFFFLSKEDAIERYSLEIREFTGKDDYNVKHIAQLHDLGYLPLEIRALPEGTLCPIGVPFITFHNTKPEFFWLTNYLETLFSAELWGPIVSATLAREFRQKLERYGKLTGVPKDFIQWQGHDFSMRGLYGKHAAMLSGIGHLFFFTGTDTIPAFWAAKNYYNAKGLIASSVPASEHSVQCAHYTGEGDEDAYMRHMLDTFPTGIVSIVCDGFDFWKFLTETVPKFKDEIMARDGRVVFRPDSGNPVDIVAGRLIYDDDSDALWEDGLILQDGKLWNIKNDTLHPEGFNPVTDKIWSEEEQKGAIEVLWNIFGGTEIKGSDRKMYKHLDPHVGLIYGDGISLDRMERICSRLVEKGFSTNNLVFGIGSFTYQHVTRDTVGIAIKATYIEQIESFPSFIENVPDGTITVAKEIFKDPKTKGVMSKKSAKGLLRVIKKEGKLTLEDQISWDKYNSPENCLKLIFSNGITYLTYFSEIRKLAKSTL